MSYQKCSLYAANKSSARAGYTSVLSESSACVERRYAVCISPCAFPCCHGNSSVPNAARLWSAPDFFLSEPHASARKSTMRLKEIERFFSYITTILVIKIL